MRFFSNILTVWILPCLLAVAALTLAAAWLRAPIIEQDLAARTTQALQSVHPWAKVTAKGRDLRLSGLAPNETALAGAFRSVKSVNGVRVVQQAAELPRVASPYETAASLDAGQVTLTGSIGDDTLRRDILAVVAATLPGVKIEDRMQWARGAPEGFMPLFAYGIGQLAGLKNGTVSFSDMHLSLTGQAATVDAFANLREALTGELPAGGKPGKVEIAPAEVSPYLLSVEKRDGRLSLSGYVPSEEARRAMLARAGQVLPGVEVEDLLDLASGQPEAFPAIADFVLEQIGRMDPASALIVDDSISLNGAAATLAGYDELLAALKDDAPVGAVMADIDIRPAAVSPYRWSAQFDGAKLALEGFAPSEDARAQAGEAANTALPGVAFENRLVIARGIPDGLDWEDATGFLLLQLPKFRQAKLALSGNVASVQGMAATPSAYDELNAAFGAELPAGMSLGSAKVERPLVEPFVWSFTIAHENQAVLGGFVPGEAIKAGNLDKVRSLLNSDSDITDNQQIAAGAPEAFGEAVAAGLEAMARLGGGSVRIEDLTVTVEGEAPTGVAANEIRAALASKLPANYLAKPQISVRKPGGRLAAVDCQQALDSQLANRKIGFESGSAGLRPESAGLLDLLTHIVRRCPQARVEIAGHTDAQGSDVANQQLSQDRAGAVRDYLVRSGVFASRLVANGYGEAEPLADNSTETGRLRNRRIEFRVIE